MRYRQLKQELDDYTKVFGEYAFNVEEYNADAARYNSLPFLTNTRSRDGRVIGGYVGGEPVAVQGARAGDRVTVVGGVARPASAPVFSAGEEPKTPTFTRKQWDEVNSPAPPVTLAQFERAAASKINKDDDWRPNGDTNTGILQRMMKGQV